MPTQQKPVFGVFGAGAWGTALAILLRRNGHRTILWGRDAAAIQTMQQTRFNAHYLPNCPLPTALEFSADTNSVLAQIDIPVLVIPSSGFQPWLQQNRTALKRLGRLVWATKGLSNLEHKLLHQVIADELGADFPCAVLSGPNFATEVAQQKPSATTIAAAKIDFAAAVSEYFHSDWFRVYQTTDVIGVQLGGALKNVLAIAAGIADGLGFGANSRAALLTRGLAELMRLGDAMGAVPTTLTGLAGVGDILLTCTDNQSRNRRLGLLLAAGKSLDAAQQEIGQVVEGVKSAAAANFLAQQYQVDMPIMQQVYRVLYQQLPVKQAVTALMQRAAPGIEHDFV